MCRFWEMDDANPHMGECRKYTPVARDGWGRTKRNDWCGEFEKEVEASPGGQVQ